jgi:predicted ATPase
LHDLVSANRVVTLTGPGGIGKTALALKIARHVLGEFTDGGWLVEPASLSDPNLVPSAVAGALGLRLAQGQRERAYAVLEPIFAAFGEGLDTADLKAAKHLLAALG